MNSLYEHRLLDDSTGYFKFHDGATPETYADAFGNYQKMVANPKVTKLIVVNDSRGSWDKSIESIWVQTAQLAEQNGITKWGIVTPDSAIRSMTLKRVVKKSNYENDPEYDYFLSQDEKEVIDWINK